MANPLGILRTGLVTSVGLSSPATCAAIRAGITNHTDTKFLNDAGEWIAGAQVTLDQPWRGRTKLLQMLQLAVEECLSDVHPEPGTLPMLLCVAESEREGRVSGLDDELFNELSEALHTAFHPELSAVIPYGRVGMAVALARARAMLTERGLSKVLVAAADSLLVWPTLSHYQAEGRLLAGDNSNGFVPGEAAGAVLIGRPPEAQPGLLCLGIGFAEELSAIGSELPLKADGLTAALKKALVDAGCGLNDLDFRITDISGEQYYFKEASLAYTRTARFRRKDFDIWHPADSIGETGAAIGPVALAMAEAACRKGYGPGPGILLHCGSDRGQRAALVLRWRGGA